MKASRANWKMKILKNTVARNKKAQIGKITKGIYKGKIRRKCRICRIMKKEILEMKTLLMKARVVGFLRGVLQRRRIRIWKLSSFEYFFFSFFCKNIK